MPENARDTSTSQRGQPWWVQLCRWLWKLCAFLGTGVLLALAVNVGSTWFTTSKGDLPADSPAGFLLAHWPIVLPIACCLLLLALLTRMVSQRDTYTSPSMSLTQQNRTRMLGRLRNTYRDLLAHSLQGAVWMELGLAEKPDVVRNATTMLWRIDNQPEHVLPPGTSLLDAYNQAEGDLLILGAPGAGKSTLLLELAQHLVERATHDTAHPLPVIFPLSSWAVKQLPLQEWITEQLTLIYDIPRRVSEQWVKEGSILPLLDGLDEMEETARPAGIAAINTYHQVHLHVPLVISSRMTDYDRASEQHRLALQLAIVIQPLAKEQIDGYLHQAGKLVAALRKALKTNTTLQELATTPLMLSVLILTYQGTTLRELPTKAVSLQKQVWTDYVERMMTHKGDGNHYPFDITRQWLSSLARVMRIHNQSVFYLEYLQSDWLTTKQQHRYTVLAIRVPALLIGMLAAIIVINLFNFVEPVLLLQYTTVGGALGYLFSRSASSNNTFYQNFGTSLHKQLHYKREDICVSLITGLIVGLCYGVSEYTPYFLWHDGPISGIVLGISIIVLSRLLPTFPPVRFASTPLQIRWHALVHLSQGIQVRRAWLVCVILGIGLMFDFGLRDWLDLEQHLLSSIGLRAALRDALGRGWDYGLFFGLIFGFISSLISLILSLSTQSISLTEHLHWTWHSLMRGLFTSKHLKQTLLITSIIVILVGLINELHTIMLYWLSLGLRDEMSRYMLDGLYYWLKDGLSNALSLGLSLGLFYWIVLGVSQGIKSTQIEDHTRRLPNQGIRRSLYNSTLLAFVSSIMIGMIGILNSEMQYWLYNELRDGVSVWPLITRLNELNYELLNGLIIVVCGGLLIWAARGGQVVLRHYLLRLMLARSHTFPLDAVRFLEDATTRILLCRVGGGYSFTHRLLLDYFADLDVSTTSRSSVHPPSNDTTQSPSNDASAAV